MNTTSPSEFLDFYYQYCIFRVFIFLFDSMLHIPIHAKKIIQEFHKRIRTCCSSLKAEEYGGRKQFACIMEGGRFIGREECHLSKIKPPVSTWKMAKMGIWPRRRLVKMGISPRTKDKIIVHSLPLYIYVRYGNMDTNLLMLFLTFFSFQIYYGNL